MGTHYKICPWCGDHLDHGERCDGMSRRPETVETARTAPPELAKAYIPTA